MYPITKETHLENLAKILKKFKSKYAFNEAYLTIEGVVRKMSHSHLTVECMDEFDKLNVKDVKNLKVDIYEQLRNYLEKNGINDTLIVRNRFKHSWANEGQELVFETVVKV
jgi:hypothetical protein